MTNGDVREFCVAVLGDSGVGKTCLLRRWINNKFEHSFVTMRASVERRHARTLADGRRCRVRVLDVGGAERFRPAASSQFRRCDAAVLVYNVTNAASFNNVEVWAAAFETAGPRLDQPPTGGGRRDALNDNDTGCCAPVYRLIDRLVNSIMLRMMPATTPDATMLDAARRVPLLLLANGTDVADDARAVSDAQGQQLAARMQALFYQTSARTGLNVDAAFDALLVHLLAEQDDAAAAVVVDDVPGDQECLLK